MNRDNYCLDKNGDIISKSAFYLHDYLGYPKDVNYHVSVFWGESKKAVDSITAMDFKFSVNDNGEQKDIDFSYELSNEGRHSMLSVGDNLNAFIEQEFTNKEGQFNYKDFYEALYFLKKSNREHFAKSLFEQSRGTTVQEMLKDRNNINFSPGALPKEEGKKAGYGDLLGDQPQRFGVIGSF